MKKPLPPSEPIPPGVSPATPPWLWKFYGPAKRLIAFLKSRPLDYEIYRGTRPTGLTLLLYSLPWWIPLALMGIIALVLWRQP